MTCLVRYSATVLSLLLLVSLSWSGGSRKQPRPGAVDDSQKSRVVYVCACLKTKSCSCMTEARLAGPCACGPQGGPPMKAVAPDSGWAKDNRDALAK